MKKIFFLTSIFALLFLTSCKQEFENWYSETWSFDGRYVIATTCAEYSDDDTSIEDGIEALIYNTAANVQNEIWIDTEIAGNSIKSKFKLNGSTDAFSASGISPNINSATYLIDTDYGLAPFTSDYTAYFRVPTSAGELNDGIQLYTRIELSEGKIIHNGATTIGGNVSDSVYLKIIAHSDYIVYVSYEIPEEDWTTPGVPEYAWRLQEDSNTPADADGWDENWTLAGYRYTGYPEDIH